MSNERNFDTFAEIVKYRLQMTRTGAIKPSAYNNSFSMRVVKQDGMGLRWDNKPRIGRQ